MEWSWKGDADKDVNSGVMTLEFSSYNLNLKLEHFSEACALSSAIDTEINLKEKAEAD